MTLNEQQIAGSQTFILEQPFLCELGGVIHSLTLAYETYGILSPHRDNAILIHHALSTNSHVASHAQNSQLGWWENMVGPGKPIDTDRYLVICINNLGSCFGSSGPASINPQTQRAYRYGFPWITINDMIHAQQHLLEYLGIECLYAVIGNSMGAMLSLAYAIHYPNRLQHLISISSCYKAYPANIANRAIQREIIQLDPAWQKGYYAINPINGLKLARKLGHFTYRNPQSLNEKFLTNHKISPTLACEIENYLDYNAEKFVRYFDANSYLYLLNAMDLFDVTRGHHPPESVFNKINMKVLVISVDSDILFTPEQQYELFSCLKEAHADVEFIQHYSTYGHDTFLVETEIIGNYITNFLQST